MKKPIVTVVIPVYRVETYLPACLDSVLSQTLREIEVICIDDASPDRCPAILDEYARRDGRMRVIHLERNRQQGYGRNLGLKNGSGTYVYFLDSDDAIRKDALEMLVRTAETDGLDGIFFDSEAVYEDEAYRASHYEPGRTGIYEDRIYGGPELFQRFSDAGDWNVYIQRQFWRREFLLRNGIRFPEGTEHEDEVFSVEAICAAERVRYLAEPYFIRRYRAGSVMTRGKNAKDFHGYFRCFRELLRFRSERGIRSDAYDRYLAHLYELAELFYPLFSDERPDEWFPDETERAAYELFAGGMEARAETERLKRASWKLLAPYRHVMFYGAGRIAKRALSAAVLADAEVRLRGFLVSSEEGNPSAIGNIPVRGLDGWMPEDRTAVLIAVAYDAWPEIRAALKTCSCDLYGFRGGMVVPIRCPAGGGAC